MAVRNYGGFGAGLAQGFGLVQGVQDRFDRNELAKDTLEAKVAGDEATADFRTKQLGLQADENRLRIESAALTAQATADNRRLTLDETNRRNLVTEGLTSSKQAFDQDPNNPANREKILDNDQRIAYAKTIEDAGRLDSYYQKLLANQDISSEDLVALNKDIELNRGGKFDFGMLASGEMDSAGKIIQAFRFNLSQDPTIEMDDNVVDAFGKSLKIGQSANVGRKIGKNWNHAPDHMKDGQYEVLSVSLAGVKGAGVVPNSDPNSPADVNLTASVYVEAVNILTGEREVYPAPLTGNRAVDSDGLVLKLSEIDEVVTANHYMAKTVAPVIRPAVRRARIIQRFGDDDGDGRGTDGQAEFAKAVNEKVDLIRKAIKDGDDTTHINFVSQENAAALAGKEMTEEQVRDITTRVEENLLFDVDAVAPQQSIRKYFESTREKLQELPMMDPKNMREAGYEYVDDKLNDRDNVTLGELYDNGLRGDEFIAQLNGVADNQTKLFNHLLSSNKIKKINDK